MRHYLFFDTETTGLSPDIHEMIEFGGIRVTEDLQHELAEFSCRIKPERIQDAAPQALQVNGYTREGWQEALSPSAAAAWIWRFCEGADAAGYNVAFDLGFTRKLFTRNGLGDPWAPHLQLEVRDMAKRALKLTRYKLCTVAEHYGLVQEEPHRALSDARLTLEIARRLRG